MSQSTAPQPPRRPSVVGDPLRTTLVVLAIIAILAGAGSLLSSPPGDPVPAVDYQPALSAARDAAPYPVLAPEDLPEGWRANSVRYRIGSDAWHLGILTDEDRYIGIEQSPDSVEELVEEFAAEAEPAGDIELGGQTWALLRTEDRTTLVRRADDATTLVTGDAPQQSIADLAADLSDGS